MKVKKIIITSILLVVFFSAFYFATMFLGKVYQRKKVNKILIQAREAAKNLETVKIKGRTLFGPEIKIDNQGVIDYVKGQFSIIQTQNEIMLSAVYYVDKFTYMYNGMLVSWIKFGEDLDMFGDILNKEKLLSSFPVDFKGTGFNVEILREEEVQGQLCYVLESSVVDEKSAKEFMLKFLDKFVSGQVARSLKDNKEARDQYLDKYVKNSNSVQWIAKDNFYAIKVVNKLKQENDKGEMIEVKNEAIYYDFNQPVKIELPEDAKGAKLITAEDIGIRE